MRYHRIEDSLAVRVESELVVLEPQDFRYFALNSPAERIWELLDAGPLTQPELVSALVAEYDVDEQACDQQVADFLASAVTAGFIGTIP